MYILVRTCGTVSKALLSQLCCSIVNVILACTDHGSRQPGAHT